MRLEMVGEGDFHESGVISRSNADSLEARRQIFRLLEEYPASNTEKERSLGLFLRASLLARYLGVFEVYERIIDIPGVIFDVGTWRGQTAVLCENFRAILEPLNLDRRIFAFDTFTGYVGFSDRDKQTDLHREGTYRIGDSYPEYLSELIKLHEISNAMGHFHGKHRVVAGDVLESIPKTFADFPNLLVSLAFLDLNSVIPTEFVIEQIWNRLVPNGILAFWQLTQPDIQGDAVAYIGSVLNSLPHSISRSRFYPGLTFVSKSPLTGR